MLVLDDGLRSGLYGDRCLRIMLTTVGSSVDLIAIVTGYSWDRACLDASIRPSDGGANGIDMVTVTHPSYSLMLMGNRNRSSGLWVERLSSLRYWESKPFIEMILNTHVEVQAVYIFADHEHLTSLSLVPQGVSW